MSAWPGKYVIGLTGNIATGKSVVRKMLEHLGAYGIDADALGHRAIAQGAPGYQAVVDLFGRWILGPDEQIDRARLGKIVFSDPQALAQLESVVHPLVRQAVDVMVRRSKQSVIVIEAIKLLESPLREGCDRILITYTPKEIQMARLMEKRGMTSEAARQRVAAQTSQEEKIAAADSVIRNDGSFEDTWRQVYALWQELFPATGEPAAEAEAEPTAAGEVRVEKARPQEAGEIAAFITQQTNGQRKLTRADVMAAFGEKAFILLKVNGKICGLAGWQVENLVARTNDVYFDPAYSHPDYLRRVMNEVEEASRDLQCEASLLFLTTQFAKQEDLWRKLGYEPRTIQSLGVRAWQEAAAESMPPGTTLLFKQLRKDRVLRPV